MPLGVLVGCLPRNIALIRECTCSDCVCEMVPADRVHACVSCAGHDDVYLTPHGFAKTPSAAHQRGRSRSQPFGEERLWSYGEDVGEGEGRGWDVKGCRCEWGVWMCG